MMRRGPVMVLNGALCLLLIWWILGCTPDGSLSERGQHLVVVACAGDALVQPILVSVVLLVAPATGPAAPAVAAAATLDQVLVHPAVVAACAAYASRPDAVVDVIAAPAAVE